jgi:hypothetical protein
MTKYLGIITLLALVLLSVDLAYADDYNLYGVLPFLSQTGKLTDTLDYNLFLSTTDNMRKTEVNGQTIKARDTQLYLQPSLIYKYSPDLNFGLGYVFQRNNPLSDDYTNENRMWQQVLFAHPLAGARITHRVRYEERFIHNRTTGADPLSTRARYQLGYMVPLEGKELDPGEFYLNGYNEAYFSLTGAKNATYSEDWLYAGVGYFIKGLGKLEIGPLYQSAVVNSEHDRREFYLAQIGFSTSF